MWNDPHKQVLPPLLSCDLWPQSQRSPDNLFDVAWNHYVKWVELIKEIVPNVTRAAVLRDPANSAGIGQFGVIQGAAYEPGLRAWSSRRRREGIVLSFLDCVAVCWLRFMGPEQVDLITQSFDEMWPHRRNLAAKFYTRFFEIAPHAQRLFPTDMERQYLKLMDTIAAIVGALNNHALFQSIIGHTARQHARFGVTASQLAAAKH